MHEMISTIAHRNDDNSWSYRTYWYDGTDENDQPEYFVSYDMGDVANTEIDAGELPDGDQEGASWRAYAEYVAQTGDDPLSNYMVDREVRFDEAWEAHYRLIDGKVTLVGAAKLGHPQWQQFDDLPRDVREYLDMTSIHDLAEACRMANQSDGVTAALIEFERPDGTRYINVLKAIALNVPRRIAIPEEQICAALKAAASEHLKPAPKN